MHKQVKLCTDQTFVIDSYLDEAAVIWAKYNQHIVWNFTGGGNWFVVLTFSFQSLYTSLMTASYIHLSDKRKKFTCIRYGLLFFNVFLLFLFFKNFFLYFLIFLFYFFYLTYLFFLIHCHSVRMSHCIKRLLDLT